MPESTRPHRRWWGDRFWAVMEAIGVARRLERGKRYARAERVLTVSIEPGLVTAVEALASQALFAAKLLSGEMPENIEDLFAEIHLPLFPASTRELEMACSCPDEVDRKHTRLN